MSSWVYIFSRFTPEALLFESLVIFMLAGSYAAFWVLKKRKLGAVDQTVPVGVVKTYLNDLIVDAEQLRAQLFGLLKSAGIQMDPSQAQMQARGAQPQMITSASPDPALLQKVSALEQRMAEQSSAMNALMLEKQKIEKELLLAKSAKEAAPSGAGDESAAVVVQLQDKIQNLEGKLAEYSVIEDDLANLKRLQQENAQLKATLKNGSAGATAASGPTTIATAATQPAAASVAAAPALEPGPSMDSMLAAAGDNALGSTFDGLVDQVEQSLKTETAPAAAAEPSTTAALNSTLAMPLSSPLDAPMDSMEKSDADLVAEFEKMLKP